MGEIETEEVGERGREGGRQTQTGRGSESGDDVLVTACLSLGRGSSRYQCHLRSWRGRSGARVRDCWPVCWPAGRWLGWVLRSQRWPPEPRVGGVHTFLRACSCALGAVTRAVPVVTPPP